MKKIKAISLHQPWANFIAERKKTIEIRTWPTKYRGDLLICSTKRSETGFSHLPHGQALAIVEIYECRYMTAEDSVAARIVYDKRLHLFSWLLRNIRPIKPFPVKGWQGFYYVEIPE